MREVRSWLFALLALAACSSSSASGDRCGDASLEGDACSQAGLYYQPCSGKVVASLPAEDCPAEACGGSVAYATCNGEDWVACVCTIPTGYTLIDAGFFGPEAGEGGADIDAEAPKEGGEEQDARSEAP